MNGNASYRQYLQYHANNHPSAAKRAEAQALLNVVGDDQRINGNFLMGQKVDRGWFRSPDVREQTSNGYNASTVNRSVNPWWQNSYNSWRQANRGGDSNAGNQNLSLGYYGGGGGGGYYGGGNRASAAQLAEYDQGIGQLEHDMGRLDGQLGIRLGNINSIDDLNFIC